jgi:hypothetical protein
MNLEQLKKKNLGSAVYLRPVPGRLQTATQKVLPPIDDQWTIYKVEDGKVELHNLRTMHVVALGSDNIREFRTPNFLMLRCQLTLTEEQVLIEPFVGGGPASEPVTGRDLLTPAPERPTIRERSAAEIFRSLNGITLDYEFRARVEELYRGRWTRSPGWQVTVASLPSKLPSGAWFCGFLEVGSAAIVSASTVQDVSALRRGDSVTISGKINDVSRLDSVHLHDATIVLDESRETLDHEANDAG